MTDDRSGDDDPRELWNARYEAGHGLATPAAFLTDHAHLPPTAGRALDVAGGAGRNALWLAERGLTVTLVDASDVALERAAAAAEAAGVELATVRSDLSPATIPAGVYAVIVVHHFLDRAVWSALPGHLAPGGTLFVCQPTEHNLERHPRPSRRWLLDAGELARFADDQTTGDPALRIVEVTEGWTEAGRHEARLILERRRG